MRKKGYNNYKDKAGENLIQYLYAMDKNDSINLVDLSLKRMCDSVFHYRNNKTGHGFVNFEDLPDHKITRTVEVTRSSISSLIQSYKDILIN